jgi:hypothetical protein
MTDHEHIRREAEWVLKTAEPYQALYPAESAGNLARHCLALLDELKQNDRDNDEILQAWITRTSKAEARLAKDQKLVEALKVYAEADPADPDTWSGPRTAREALAAWEDE